MSLTRTQADIQSTKRSGDNGAYSMVKVINENPPSVERWRYTKAGVTRSDTDTINTALAASRAVMLEDKTYNITASLQAQSEATIWGITPVRSVINRIGNWGGNTLKIGQDLLGQGSYAAHLRGFKMQQDHTGFVPGTSVSIPNRNTFNVRHVELWGGGFAVIEDVHFDGLAGGIWIKGAAYPAIRDCKFSGAWDALTAALQETYASIQLSHDAVHGLCTVPNIDGCSFEGVPTPARNITVGSTTFNSHQDGGPKYHIFVDGTEGMRFRPKYIGAANDCLVNFTPTGICNNIDIEGGFWDSATNAQIKFDAPNSSQQTALVSLRGLNLNPQQLGLHGIWANNSSAAPTVSGLVISNCVGQGWLKTALNLAGARRAKICNNIFASYNTRNSGDASPDYSAGAYVSGNSSEVHFNDNLWGGGLNSFVSDTTAKWGPYFASALGTASNERVLRGIAGGSDVGGVSQTYPT